MDTIGPLLRPTAAAFTLLSPPPQESDATSQLKSTVCSSSTASNGNKLEEEGRRIGKKHSWSLTVGFVSATAGNGRLRCFRELKGSEDVLMNKTKPMKSTGNKMNNIILLILLSICLLISLTVLHDASNCS